MNTDNMWRQADKSYICPSDMHDRHIINALRKGAHALFQFSDEVGSATRFKGECISANIDAWTQRQWNNILVANPTLIKLYDEAIKRRLVKPADVKAKPDPVSPLAQGYSGHPVARCHDCNSPFVRVDNSTYANAQIVACGACQTMILSKNAIDDWNSLFLMKNAATARE